jgi:phage terminase small subunit
VTTLTPKQEKFAQAYIETGNASEAYRQAYNAGNMTAPVINVRASELLKHGGITVRIAELQSRHAERHNVTIDSLTEMLKEDRELARKNDEASAAITAVMSIAKLHGLVVEKINSTNRHHHTAEPVSAYSRHLADVLGIGTEGETPPPLPN